MAFNPGEDLPGRPSKRSKASLNDSTPQIEYDLTDDNGNVIAYFDNTTLDPPRTATPSSESVCMANDSDISMSDIRGSPECTASSRSCNETTIASTSTSSYFLYDDLRRSANNTDIPAYGSSSKAYRHGDSSSTKDDGIARLNKNEDEQRDIIRSKIMMHSTYLPRDERLLHYVINLSPFASYDSRVRAEGWDSVAKLCNQAIAGLHENKKGVYNFGSGDAAERRFETIMDAHVQVNNGKQDLLDIDFYTAYEAMLPMIEKAYAMVTIKHLFILFVRRDGTHTNV
ncbi:hypothetical protein BX666DRAFT_1242187 [Dichotomocladium elegans]|nr:hypothetical protein BX666DRAFT_1242187 [Dichotomocladium elegans]